MKAIDVTIYSRDEALKIGLEGAASKALSDFAIEIRAGDTVTNLDLVQVLRAMIAQLGAQLPPRSVEALIVKRMSEDLCILNQLGEAAVRLKTV